MANEFRGRDRRLLTSLAKTIQDIQLRDGLVGQTRKTRKLSNRVLMFPGGGTPDLSTALAEIGSHANLLLTQQRVG